ncbi:unnamed protein product [Parnassius mnemosyne]|uniref:Chromo domain-containing protein n=1 Tax=Parnassius mnemosyne TaxID=213953 RepID=A0AAV1KF21_9NEOP
MTSSAEINKTRLRELTTKRVSAKGQITKFKNYLNSVSSKTDLYNVQFTELSLKLAKFEALFVKIDDLQSEIEVLNYENISAEVEERDNIEQEIIINIAKAKTLVERFSKQLECEKRRNSLHNASCCVDHPGCREAGLNLPQIQITKFDGSYFRWLEFRDTFENFIHKNDRISDIHKFHYLVSYLQGEAARIISNLEVSTKNYSEAWNMICYRYDNKRILVNHHLNALFNIKQLPRESERSLRFMVDHITKNLHALSSLGQPTDKWDVLIIFMSASKLDSSTLLKWQEYRNTLTSDVPSLEQFYKFLIDRADVLESMSRNNRTDTKNISKSPSGNIRHTANNNYNYAQRFHQNNNTIKTFASTSNNYSKKSNIFTCIICNECHRIYDWPTFRAKGIDERMMDVTKYKLCVNCLRQGHPESECRMGPCRERDCKERHNSLLHRPSSSCHKQIDFFYLSQTYSKIPKQLLRDNANFIIIFKQDDVNLKHIYEEQVSSNMSWNQFENIFNIVWSDTLNNVIYEYNHTYHRTISEIPANVNNKSKKRILQRYLSLVKNDNIKRKLKVGDYVRISKYKGTFEKRYTPNWSTEIFKIRKLQNTIPTTYLIEDTIRGQPILGGFYAQELQKTKNSNIYLVEKVLRRKGNKVLVKWLGLSSTANSWIDKSNKLTDHCVNIKNK